MRKYVSALFIMLFLISMIGAAYTATITTQTSVNLKPEEERQQVDNMTLIVYPDQTIELQMFHEETPAPDNATVDMLFELLKENETYSGSAEATIIPPEEELEPFANVISSISVNGTYVDNELVSEGAVHFLGGVPIAAIYFWLNVSETEKAFRVRLEDTLLPLIMNETTGAPQQFPYEKFVMPPNVFLELIGNLTDMLNTMVENCTVNIVESSTTDGKVFVCVNVTTEPDFVLGEFSGLTNVTAFFNASNVMQNITINGLWEGQGNAKLQFEVFAKFDNGAPSEATLSILLTDSADRWTLTADGEFTFTNAKFFALTFLDLSLILEGNATEAFTDLSELLIKFIPPEEEPPFEDIIEFESELFEAVSAIEIREFSFQISYANGQFSAECDFEISGNVDDALAEAKNAWLDFIAEMDPNVTEEVWYQFLDKTDIKPGHIKLEMRQSTSTGLTGEIIIKRIKTEAVGNATLFRFPLFFEALNDTEYAGTATLKIVGGENETHQVYLHIPEDIPEPMEQTDRYAIWNMTKKDFVMAELGEILFESRQVVFPIVVAGQETEIEVVANVSGVTVANVSYETSYTMLGTTKGLKFVVSGPSGTIATVNITIPKDVVPSGAQLTVYINGEPAPDAKIFETETEYIIMVTVHFSEVIIYVDFTTPVERYLFAIIGGVVVLLLIIVAASILLRKKK